MNRRQFIKASVPAVAIPAIAITCKYEDDEKAPEETDGSASTSFGTPGVESPVEQPDSKDDRKEMDEKRS